MSEMSSRLRRQFYWALGGTALVSLCCFTPILVLLLGAVGLSLFVPYLDFVLLPALALLILLAVISYFRWRKEA